MQEERREASRKVRGGERNRGDIKTRQHRITCLRPRGRGTLKVGEARVLEIRDLRHRIRHGGRRAAVRGRVDAEAGRETLAVVGRAGRAKTTLLEMSGRMRRPKSGLVKLGGVEPYGLEERARDAVPE